MAIMCEVQTRETTKSIIIKIRKIIFDTYKCLFRGKLKVIKTQSGYSLIIGIPSNDKPSTITVDGTLDDFYKYITLEFKDNKRYVADFKRVDLITYD